MFRRAQMYEVNEIIMWEAQWLAFPDASLEDLFVAKVFFLKYDASDMISLGFTPSNFSDQFSFHGEGLF